MACLTNKSILITIMALLCIADASRILGVFPHPSLSHQVVFRSLTIELARRGHELIVFTPDPVNDPTIPNYTEIDLHVFYTYSTENLDFYSKYKLGHWSFVRDIYQFNERVTEDTLSHPFMQRLISPNSTEKFDLIIVQSMLYDALYALSNRFHAPLIGVSSTLALNFHHYIMGNHLLLAYSPDIFLGFDQNMNLWQRFMNIYYHIRQIYEYRYIVIPIQEKISRKHFGDSVPPADQLSSNIDMLLVNGYPFYSYPRPNVPGIIQIGGCHMKYSNKSLPQDLEKILNDTKEGYIYFSLGSNMKSIKLPIDRRDMLLRTFAELPYKVFWKFESDDITNLPNNVVVRKWFPQMRILSHPNIRLFIYQGGLQSTEEAIKSGVPVIGFPVFADQFFNTRVLYNHGVGKILNFIDINEEKLKEAISEVITNSSYKENMLKLRDLLHDLPYDPMDNAIWWIEHVIRHRGAPHLRNKSRDMPWYQIELLDIMAIVLGIAIIVIYTIVAAKRYIIKNNKGFIMWIKGISKYDKKKQE